MSVSEIASLIYAVANREAGDARWCWATARRAARFLVDDHVLPNEELAFSTLDNSTVGVARFLCNSRGKLQNHAMISVKTKSLPRAVSRRLKSLANSGTVRIGKTWR